MSAISYQDSATGFLVVAGDRETVLIIARSRLDLIRRTLDRYRTADPPAPVEAVAFLEAVVEVEGDAVATLESGARETSGVEIVYAVSGPERPFPPRPSLRSR